jgi:predicted kinase
MSEIEYPSLVVMVGFPRSGKSTLVDRWYIPHGYACVSPDTIRRVLHGKSYLESAEHHVWSIVYAMADSLLFRGNRVVVDATSINRRRRDPWVKRGAVFHLVGTSVEACLERARGQSNAVDIIPIIESMANEWEPLGEGETSWQPPVSTLEQK